VGGVPKWLRQPFELIPDSVRDPSASSSRVKVRPVPESDRMRFRASRSPASRRGRLFSARSASDDVVDVGMGKAMRTGVVLKRCAGAA
jgi:hypothetical protein